MAFIRFICLHWFLTLTYLLSLFCNVFCIYLALKFKELYFDSEEKGSEYAKENVILLQKVHKQETTIVELERRNNKLKKELEKVKDDSKRDERASD